MKNAAMSVALVLVSASSIIHIAEATLRSNIFTKEEFRTERAMARDEMFGSDVAASPGKGEKFVAAGIVMERGNPHWQILYSVRKWR